METGSILQPTLALLVVQVNPTAELNPLSDVTMIDEVAVKPGVTTAEGDENPRL
jgi:hypothetical protein